MQRNLITPTAKELRENEKMHLEEMEVLEKAKYYASKKSTWITVGTVIVAIASGDYLAAAAAIFG